MEIEFQAFEKIPRLKRGVVVSEKIDGTNAQILITELPDTEVMPTHLPIVAVVGKYLLFAGSRTRFLVPGKATDNFGFAGWVKDNAEVLALLGPGRHYGEWWGKGIQRGYNIEGKRFSLFNVKRWEHASPEDSGKAKLEAIGVSAVPVLAVGDFTDAVVESAMTKLRESGSVAAPGFMKPEGIVVFHSASGKLFKRTLEGDEAPKSAVPEAVAA